MSRRLKTAALLLAAIVAMSTTALGAAGCGSDDNDDSTTDDQVSAVILDQAEKSAERSALASAKRARDRYLPGPIELRTACSEPVPPPLPETPYQLRCYVEGFGTPPGKDVLTYMTGEDWLVPVDSAGKAGEATIQGQARIRAYRRRDDRLNCTNRKVRPERCAPPLPGQEAVLPPTVPQREPQPVPLNP